MAYILWERDITLLAAAFGLGTEQLTDSVPTLQSYTAMLKERPEKNVIEVTDKRGDFVLWHAGSGTFGHGRQA